MNTGRMDRLIRMKLLFVLGFCLADVSGCNTQTVQSEDPSAKGSAVLTITTTGSMEVSTYDIVFTSVGQSKPAVKLEGIDASTTKTDPVDLEAGSWTVTGSAKNASGGIPGQGTATITISAEQTTFADLTISRFDEWCFACHPTWK